jgi:hypothetical protein
MPSMPEDLPAPAPEMGGASSEMPAPEMGDSTPDMGEPSTDDMPSGQSDTSKRSDYMAEIQKFAGKLGQELRDQQPKMESDDIKYVLNMIISAVNLDNLEEEDIEDIAKKFERDEEFNDEEEIPSDEEEIPSEDDLSEMDSMDALETFINTPMDTEEDYEPRKFDKDYSKWDGDVEEIDLSKYADLGETETEDDIQELDLDEIKNEINRSVGETLSKYFK